MLFCFFFLSTTLYRAVFLSFFSSSSSFVAHCSFKRSCCCPFCNHLFSWLWESVYSTSYLTVLSWYIDMSSSHYCMAAEKLSQRLWAGTIFSEPLHTENSPYLPSQQIFYILPIRAQTQQVHDLDQACFKGALSTQLLKLSTHCHINCYVYFSFSVLRVWLYA